MKEQSQIDEMRAAIRGDLERSRARRQTLAAPPRETEHVDEAPAEQVRRPGLFSSLFRRR